ncbi:hypothetical protein YC2023_081727 [Brassica napus]
MKLLEEKLQLRGSRKSIEFSAEIWSNLTKGLLGHHYTYDCMNTVHELAKNDLDCQRLFLIRYAFQITIPSIWMERNRLNHGDPSSRPLSLHKTVDNDIQNRLSLSHLRYDSVEKYEDLQRIFGNGVANSGFMIGMGDSTDARTFIIVEESNQMDWKTYLKLSGILPSAISSRLTLVRILAQLEWFQDEIKAIIYIQQS